jgi:hypothetical protein
VLVAVGHRTLSVPLAGWAISQVELR